MGIGAGWGRETLPLRRVPSGLDRAFFTLSELMQWRVPFSLSGQLDRLALMAISLDAVLPCMLKAHGWL